MDELIYEEMQNIVVPEESSDNSTTIVEDVTYESIVIPEVPKILSNEEIYVYIPTVRQDTPGIAKFDPDIFIIVDGEVFIKLASATQKGIASFNDNSIEVIEGNVTIKKAANESFGVIKGNYSDTPASTVNFMVDMTTGEINNIYVKSLTQIGDTMYPTLPEYLHNLETKIISTDYTGLENDNIKVNVNNSDKTIEAILKKEILSTYVYEQGIASDIWEIQHNLDKYPSVTVIDSAGDVVVGDINYVNSNEIILTFASEFTGKAYLN